MRISYLLLMMMVSGCGPHTACVKGHEELRQIRYTEGIWDGGWRKESQFQTYYVCDAYEVVGRQQ